jgi:uncharacterized protein YutE (UPF0331/DUF86 family)
LANLRDALVHEPETLNRELLYDYMQHNLADFREFITTIEEKMHA